MINAARPSPSRRHSGAAHCKGEVNTSAIRVRAESAVSMQNGEELACRWHGRQREQDQDPVRRTLPVVPFTSRLSIIRPEGSSVTASYLPSLTRRRTSGAWRGVACAILSGDQPIPSPRQCLFISTLHLSWPRLRRDVPRIHPRRPPPPFPSSGPPSWSFRWPSWRRTETTGALLRNCCCCTRPRPAPPREFLFSPCSVMNTTANEGPSAR